MFSLRQRIGKRIRPGFFLRLPPEAQAFLREASRSWADTDRARIFLKKADHLYGHHLPVVVG